jgi:hypothetical protein
MLRRNRLAKLTLAVLLIGAATTAFLLPRLSVNERAQAAATGNCGITRTGNGYSLQWLHTAQGNIVASSGCTIDLRGFNWPGLGFGDAIGSGSVQRVNSDISRLGKTFRMNIYRVFLNAVWWNEDVAVPRAGMHYRAWVQQVVHLMESNGNYVLLTKGPQFHEPPCGGKITYCPPQNQGSLDLKKDPHNPVYQQESTSGQYIDDAVQMWTSVAALYANDPAVLYDSWNEMHKITPQMWQQHSNTLIQTIQKQNPRALVLLGGPSYENGIAPLIKGEVPSFTEPNLVYDFHVYNGYTGSFQGKACQEPDNQLWVDWPKNADSQVGYAQRHGAVSFSEWGGCSDTEPYNTDITSFAASHHILLTYYTKDMVMNLTGKGGYQLNSNGIKVQAAYAAMG